LILERRVLLRQPFLRRAGLGVLFVVRRPGGVWISAFEVVLPEFCKLTMRQLCVPNAMSLRSSFQISLSDNDADRHGVHEYIIHHALIAIDGL